MIGESLISPWSQATRESALSVPLGAMSSPSRLEIVWPLLGSETRASPAQTATRDVRTFVRLATKEPIWDLTLAFGERSHTTSTEDACQRCRGEAALHLKT